MICIDGQTDKFKAQGLKKVPTIIIPSINKQFEGYDCIKWLEDMKRINSTNNFIPQDELIVPDVSLFMSGSNNQSGKFNGPNLSQPNLSQPNIPISNNNNQLNNKNLNQNISLNTQMNELSNQLNQLSSQINNSSNDKSKNQFEVNKNNTVKRSTLSVAQPPLSNNFKQRQGNQNMINPNLNSNSNSNSGPSVKPINQLFGFLQNEMSGFSDGYAYISIDNPLPKSFLPPDKDMEIYTAPEGEKIDRRKQDEIIKTYELERTNEKNQFAQEIHELNSRIAMGDLSAMPKWLGSNPNL